ncbi:MAG: transcriptional regulator [Flavobacteriaceae bacterium]|nr:transcriptional regulator [Flavobacteriaceae bacterium]
MKILKYFFLLIVLLSVGSSVFIATQKSDYKTVKSKIINSPKSSVFNYINEYKNWGNWYVWENDTTQIYLKYSNKSYGVGSSYYWAGNSGEVKSITIFEKKNESIIQKTDFNGAISETTWKFKDTIGGTKVTCISKGEMPFMFKIKAFLNGGIENVIGSKLEKSLLNLDRSLDYELNTFSIKPNGIVIKKSSFYLFQTINCKILKLNYNLNIIIPNLITFSEKNNLKVKGKPFVIYNSYDVKKGITNVSVCLTIKNRIFTSSGSDISCKESEAFSAFKTTLIGDYSHRELAWEKATNYLIKDKQIQNKSIPIIEIFTKSLSEVKRPSKWETTIYIPIQSNFIKRANTVKSVDDTLEAPQITP